MAASKHIRTYTHTLPQWAIPFDIHTPPPTDEQFVRGVSKFSFVQGVVLYCTTCPGGSAVEHGAENCFTRSFLAPKQACSSFIGPPRRLKRFLSDLSRTYRQDCTSFTGPQQRCKLQDLSWHLNRLARASQDLHSGENCFPDLSWHLNRLVRAS